MPCGVAYVRNKDYLDSLLSNTLLGFSWKKIVSQRWKDIDFFFCSWPPGFPLILPRSHWNFQEFSTLLYWTPWKYTFLFFSNFDIPPGYFACLLAICCKFQNNHCSLPRVSWKNKSNFDAEFARLQEIDLFSN